MGKKKIKSSTKGKKRVPREDVQASTSLPPGVDGQLRCFLRVSVSKILWMVPKPPDVTFVRLKWWGEQAEGTVFRPTDVKNPQKALSRTTTRYGIRSGPKQYSAYVHDMGPLVFEVLGGSSMKLKGQVEVPNLGALVAPGKPLNGFFTVYSVDATEKKVADLHISMVFEPLMASFDSSGGSVPTTDISIDTRGSTDIDFIRSSSGVIPQPLPRSQVTSSSDDLFTSPLPPKDLQKTDGRVTPRGVDDDYSFVIGPGASTDTGVPSSQPQTIDRTTIPERESGIPQTTVDQPSKVSTTQPRHIVPVSQSTHEVNPRDGQGGDILSSLLERGTKLRNEMIKAELETDHLTSDTGNESTDIVLTSSEKPLPRQSKRRTSTGELFKEILDTDDKTSKQIDTNASSEDIEVESRTVDLVIGDHYTDRELKALKAIQDGGSPGSSFSSGHDSILSDPTDPLHDSSILEELFYNRGIMSDSESEYSSDDETRPSSGRSMSVDDPSNVRPPSRRSSIRSQDTPEKETDPDVVKSKLGRRQMSGSDSESDAMSTSRVSFDGPMDDEHKDDDDGKIEGMSVERLTLLGRVHVARVTVDTLKLDPSAILSTPVKGKTKTKGKGKPPRPSPSKSKKAATYFVEYQFPVVATSRDKDVPNTMATEVMRVASKKVSSDGVVAFNHRSVFPVLFDGTAVDKWWKQLLVFKVFSKSPGQKSPTQLGVCSLPLRSILLSDNLTILAELGVRDKARGSSSSSTTHSRSSLSGDIPSDSDVSKGKTTYPYVGGLNVSIELASDSKDFPMALAKTKVAEMKGATIIPLPYQQPKKTQPIPAGVTETEGSSAQATQTGPVIATVDEMPGRPELETRETLQPIRTVPGLPGMGQTSRPYVHSAMEQPKVPEFEPLTLHSLLMIPEGRGITLHGVPSTRPSSKTPQLAPKPLPGVGIAGRDLTVRNTYLVCRMFWCDDVVRSSVSWGTSEPNYDFIQVAPVLVTTALLERTRSNFMVVEVWDKKTSAENDQLVGIVKISLHQFYMSFRDRKIANTLLRSQYPVVAVDNFVPIMNPFTGAQFGQLKVVLALGSTEQISALQRIKLDKDIGPVRAERPEQYLERGDIADDRDRESRQPGESDTLVEHTFEVVVEGIRGFPQLENAVWGEADCFIQYHFPTQQHDSHSGPTLSQGTPTVTPHRTATTLCVPDPTFHDVTRHRLLLPQGLPVQRELLTACAGVGGGAGGIPFEVWCRYYYPNIRDQVVAKGLLPLAKLCAMVTMQKRGEPSVQTFSLPLTMQMMSGDSERDPEQSAKLKDGGLLDVTINYKTSVIPNLSSTHQSSIANKMTGAQVCISVGILRACGLKAAATALARHDAGMQYASEVGVNAYVKVQLSFLTKEDQRITRTVARTFAPDFSYHMDFPSPLLWSEAHHDVLSLAELLETAEVTFQIWHQVPGFRPEQDVRHIDIGTETTKMTGRKLFSGTGDVLLGSTTIPLEALLTHKTGIKGWYPLNIASVGWDGAAPKVSSQGSPDASQIYGSKGLERVAGGIELAIKFAHHDDRDRVIHAARGVGWSPDVDIENMDDFMDDKDDGITDIESEVSINLDTAWFPLKCALIAGQKQLDKYTKAYIRYKFYDRAALCSKLCYLDVNEEDYIAVDLKHSHNFHCQSTQPFSWYLREERLELQLWVSYNSDPSGRSDSRPRHRDKLIGCAYVDMSVLADKRRQHHRISGLYPLFKPGSVDMGGACMRVHINMKPHTGRYDPTRDEDEDIQMSRHSDSVRHGRTRQPISSDSAQDELTSEEIAAREREMEIERERKRLEEEEKERRRPIAMKVSVERAMHLPLVMDMGRSKTCKPNCYVTYKAGEDFIHTPVVEGNDCPVWEHEEERKITRNDIENNSLVFKVWHRSPSRMTSQSPDKSSDRVLGFVSVDLAPLLAGLKQICGWYNIMDFTGQCQGQIKVGILPLEGISPLKRREKPVSVPSSPSTSAKFSTSARYAAFPSHLVQYPEQAVRLETEHKPPSHYAEHFDNVKKYHKNLQEQRREHLRELREREKSDEIHHVPTSGLIADSASSSLLLSNLRRQMQDLDDMQKNMREKLSRYDDLLPTSMTSEPQHHTTGASYAQLADILHGTVSDVLNSRPPRQEHSKPRESAKPPHERNGERDFRKVQAPSGHDLPQDDIVEDIHPSSYSSKEAEDAENLDNSVPFSEEESDHEDGDLIIPRALNDISSPDFSNFLPEYLRDRQAGGTYTKLSEIPKYDTLEEMPMEDSLSDAQRHDRQDERVEEISPWSSPTGEESPAMVSDQLSSKDYADDGDGVGGQSSEISAPHDDAHSGEDDQLETAQHDARSEQDGYAGDIDDSQQDIPASPTVQPDPSTDPATQGDDRPSQQQTDDQTSNGSAQEDARPPHQARSSESNDEMSGEEKMTQPSQRSHGDKPEEAVLLENVSLDASDESNPGSGGHVEIPHTDSGDGMTDVSSGKSDMQAESDNSVVLTLDTEQALRQEMTHTREEPRQLTSSSNDNDEVPNFFLPPQDLEASMRALRMATALYPRSEARTVSSDENDERSQYRSQTRREYSERVGNAAGIDKENSVPGISRVKQGVRPTPTAEQTKRIAKIFSSRFSTKD
ncbi:C2 domain-containing protein 3-like [Ptychodera flava]|uniref:C2 domain-containing protein 3-like n=1 Tax=Ptychodera flava TaxID=63121 RepID=UPI003969E9E8